MNKETGQQEMVATEIVRSRLRDALAMLDQFTHAAGSPNSQQSASPPDFTQQRSESGVVTRPGPERGQRIGSYQLVEKLSVGAIEYWSAHTVDQYKAQVCIKLTSLRGPAGKQILKRERDVLAGISHENVIKLLDYGSDGDFEFNVIEYIHGPDLLAYCASTRSSVEERLKLFATICSGVHELHEKHIAFQYLVPKDILIVMKGSEPVPKLVGLACSEFGGRPTHATPTISRYASPERVASQSPSRQSDIFSLGCILCELLTDDTPVSLAMLQACSAHTFQKLFQDFTPRTPSEVLNGYEKEVLRSVCTARQTGSANILRKLRLDLDRMVRRAIAVNPKHRYSSASEFALDVLRYLEHFPSDSSIPSPLNTAGRTADRLTRQILDFFKTVGPSSDFLFRALLDSLFGKADRSRRTVLTKHQTEGENHSIDYLKQNAVASYEDLSYSVVMDESQSDKADMAFERRLQLALAVGAQFKVPLSGNFYSHLPTAHHGSLTSPPGPPLRQIVDVFLAEFVTSSNEIEYIDMSLRLCRAVLRLREEATLGETRDRVAVEDAIADLKLIDAMIDHYLAEVLESKDKWSKSVRSGDEPGAGKQV